MNAEHRRPFVAFFLVAVVCALGLGNAVQSRVPEVPTEVLADRVPVPRPAPVPAHHELVGESPMGVLTAHRFRARTDRSVAEETPRRERVTAQAGIVPEVRPGSGAASGAAGSEDAQQDVSPVAADDQHQASGTLVQREAVRETSSGLDTRDPAPERSPGPGNSTAPRSSRGHSATAPGQVRRGGSATGRGRAKAHTGSHGKSHTKSHTKSHSRGRSGRHR